jgi:hypothetical protein
MRAQLCFLQVDFFAPFAKERGVYFKQSSKDTKGRGEEELNLEHRREAKKIKKC